MCDWHANTINDFPRVLCIIPFHFPAILLTTFQATATTTQTVTQSTNYKALWLFVLVVIITIISMPHATKTDDSPRPVTGAAIFIDAL